MSSTTGFRLRCALKAVRILDPSGTKKGFESAEPALDHYTKALRNRWSVASRCGVFRAKRHVCSKNLCGKRKPVFPVRARPGKEDYGIKTVLECGVCQVLSLSSLTLENSEQAALQACTVWQSRNWDSKQSRTMLCMRCARAHATGDK